MHTFNYPLHCEIPAVLYRVICTSKNSIFLPLPNTWFHSSESLESSTRINGEYENDVLKSLKSFHQSLGGILSSCPYIFLLRKIETFNVTRFHDKIFGVLIEYWSILDCFQHVNFRRIIIIMVGFRIWPALIVLTSTEMSRVIAICTFGWITKNAGKSADTLRVDNVWSSTENIVQVANVGETPMTCAKILTDFLYVPLRHLLLKFPQFTLRTLDVPKLAKRT